MYGGAGAQALRLAIELKKNKLDVSALAAHLDPRYPRNETIGGVDIHRLGTPRPKRLASFFFFLSVAWHVFQHRKEIELVHIHGAYMGIIPVLFVAKRLGIPCVVKMSSMGTDDPESIGRRRYGACLLNSLGSADAVVGISRELSAAYRRRGLPPDRLVEIPNGVDTDRFRPADEKERRRLRQKLGLSLDGPLVVFTGVVRVRKGIDTLLSAWRFVARKHPDASLVLVGPVDEMEPADRTTLLRSIEESPGTVVPGFKREVEDYLRAADIFVLPSRVEGLANALIEAMACGLSSIASNIGGNADLIEDGATGILFDAGNSEELGRRICDLIDDPAERERIGIRARESMVAGFSIESTAKRYEDLYSGLIGT
jgi:glycosyltransferase involved in cell wall biosynthesis